MLCSISYLVFPRHQYIYLCVRGSSFVRNGQRFEPLWTFASRHLWRNHSLPSSQLHCKRVSIWNCVRDCCRYGYFMKAYSKLNDICLQIEICASLQMPYNSSSRLFLLAVCSSFFIWLILYSVCMRSHEQMVNLFGQGRKHQTPIHVWITQVPAFVPSQSQSRLLRSALGCLRSWCGSTGLENARRIHIVPGLSLYQDPQSSPSADPVQEHSAITLHHTHWACTQSYLLVVSITWEHQGHLAEKKLRSTARSFGCWANF